MTPKRLPPRRLAKFKKMDLLTRALTEILFYVDPIKLSKITEHLDEYSCEAQDIIKKIKTTPEITPYRCGQIAWKVFVDGFDEQNANAYKEWNKLGEAIYWLHVNEGNWTL